MNIDEDDREVIPDFCNFVIQCVLDTINTKVNRKKISLRLDYILNQVQWIKWIKSKKYNTSASDLMKAITQSLRAVPYKNNVWKIEVDANVLIPNSYTSIDRFIRFLNYGDTKMKATGIFTKLEHDFNHNKLNALWKCFALQKFGDMSEVTIIARK